MKNKYGMFLTIALVGGVLAACDDSYSVEENAVVLNAKHLEVDSQMVGKVTDYYLLYEDSKGKKQKKELEDNVAVYIRDELEVVKKANKILESKEEVEFDLFIDGGVVQGISLSKNRK